MNAMATVKRQYDNSRREAQSRQTRLRIIEAARSQFIEHGYPAATLEEIAAAADTSLPTLYRLFSSKRVLLKEVLDVTLGGDDQPIAFGDRPEVQVARTQQDPTELVRAFARIGREFMARSAPILHVLSTAAQVDPGAAQLMADFRQQRHAGQSRIVAALVERGALDPSLSAAEAADIVYAAMSPDVYRIFTIDRGWTPDMYERWIARSLGTLLRQPSPYKQAETTRSTDRSG